ATVARRELPSRERHDRDLALSPCLVVVVCRPLLGHQRPQARSLLALGRGGACRDMLALDLDLDGRVCLEVLVPVRVAGRSALGCDDHPAVAVVAVDQRRRAHLAALATLRREQQDARPAPVVTALARLDEPPAQLERYTGWTVKPQGACRGEVCVPLERPLDVRELARRLRMALVHDERHGLWALGPEYGAPALTSAELPDIVLPDR